MARLRNARSGVIVNVDDVTAASLDDAEWVDPDAVDVESDAQREAAEAGGEQVIAEEVLTEAVEEPAVEPAAEPVEPKPARRSAK